MAALCVFCQEMRLSNDFVGRGALAGECACEVIFPSAYPCVCHHPRTGKRLLM